MCAFVLLVDAGLSFFSSDSFYPEVVSFAIARSRDGGERAFLRYGHLI